MVSGTFYPRKFGGVTAVSYNVAKKLVEHGHKVTVYTTDVGNSQFSRLNVQDTKIMNGIKVRYFKNISNFFAFKHRLYLPIGMFSDVRRDMPNFDIIHFHDYRSFLTVIVHHYAKKHKIPYVLQAHGSILPFFQKQRLKELYDLVWGYKILKDTSKAIALTETEAIQYKKMGIDEDKIEIIPNGIDLTEFRNLPKRGEFREKYGVKSGERMVLYLNRINKIKGIDLLVRAFADLTKRLGNVKLVIAGPDDGFLSNLKKQIKDLKIEDRILITGPLYAENKLRAFVDSDVYVLPSFYEIFSITVLEAWACGTPVILTDRCGMADYVKKIGCVVEYDKNKLEDAITKTLTDEGLRRKFRKEGMRVVREKFRWDRIVEQLENIYKNCLPLKTSS